MKSSEIQYRYAYNSSNEIIDVSQLERATVRRESFACISCGNPLMAKLGEIKQKHFCHKQVQNCSSETYLHKLAKETFAREYQACLDDKKPFYIELKIERTCNAYEGHFGDTCQLWSVTKQFDLTKRYKRVEIEKRHDGFIPDILLSDETGEKHLLIEIAVTHKISAQKANSKAQIIEINIQKEDDISFIKDHILKQSNPKIKLVNIQVRPEIGNLCNSICLEEPEHVYLFVVLEKFDVYGAWTNYTGLNASRLFCSANTPTYHRLFNACSGMSLRIAHKMGVVEAWNSGIPIKDCFLCQHHLDNRSDLNSIDCRLHFSSGWRSQMALKCRNYKPNPDYFPKTFVMKTKSHT